tara:strand:- start:745 stop:873 length:129 start_codon:yes stop_codon:yes gene_type:complete
MRRLLKSFNRFLQTLIDKGKQAEQKKAGEEWESIVEELKNRK